jgi:hypothetical protein
MGYEGDWESMSVYEDGIRRSNDDAEFERIVGGARPKSPKPKARPKSAFGPRDSSSTAADPAMNQFVADSWDIIDELGNLLISKQRDYGPGNINNAYGGPINGLMVRMGDKFERLKNLLASGHTPQHESIEDSFKDLANYCIIAMMVTRGKWPENK